MNFSSKKKWFTLIEMLIVIVIIGVLASALIPRLWSARGKANDVARKADLQQVATAIISYQIDQNKFPEGPASFTSWDFKDALVKWGIASIPEWDTTIWSWMVSDSTVSGYMYYPMKKNGSPKNWFILVAKAETEGWANYVFNWTVPVNDNGSTDVEEIELCSSVKFDDKATNPDDCTATDKSQFRYIYKY